MTITITPTQLLPQQVRVQKPLDLKTLFGASDNTGTINKYQIAVSNSFKGTITDTTTGHSIGNGVAGTLTEDPNDTFVYTASSSVGTESFTIAASDDAGATYSNAVTVQENVVANTAPTVMAVANDPNTITVNKTFNAAQLFQATDVNFDPIARYVITTPAAGSGAFTLGNGATTLDQGNVTGALAASTTYTISGSDLANLSFKTGSNPGSETFQVAAYDGLDTGSTLQITLDVRNNTVPTVTTLTPAKPILTGNSFTAASSLIQASDLDGSSITGYTIQASGANQGFFTLTHDTTPVALDANNQFFVTAAQFQNLEYVSNATTAGTDQFNVTAIATPDASQPAKVIFSPVTPLSVNVVATASPVITQSTGAAQLVPSTSVAASQLFSATDPKGTPVQGYSIIPTRAGQFTLNGVALAANTPTFVSAANFPNLRFNTLSGAGSETFQVAATDGTSLGAFATITATTTANATPTIALPSTVPNVEPNNAVLASTLFTGSEPGGTIQSYSIIVPSTVGYLTLNGTKLATDQPVLVSAADFASLKFVATTAAGSASLQAAVFDGKTFSGYSSVPLNLVGPTVSKLSTIGTNGLVTGQTYNATSLFALNPAPKGAAVTGFSLQTPPSSEATFFLNGTALSSNQPVFLNASDLKNLTVQIANAAGPVSFQVSAFDGTAFGQPAQFSLTSVANSEPTVSSAQANLHVAVGHTVLASSLFTASDLNGDAIAAYEITPGAVPGGGVFRGTGLTFTPGQATTVTAAQLATLTYTAGGPSPTFTIAGNVDQTGFPVTVGVGTGYSFTTDDGSTYTGDLQFNVTSANSADLQLTNIQAVNGAPAPTAAVPLTLGTVAFDGSNNATGFTPAATAPSISASGRLFLSANSVKFGAGLTDLAAATSLTASVQSFQTGQDSFTVKARDAAAANFASSTAATIKVQTLANQPPTAVALPQTLPQLTGASVAGTSLFSASDPDGDPIQGYSIELPAGALGSFTGFTSQDPTTGLIYVSAADLTNLRFHANSAGNTSFNISAYDGQNWGPATTVPVSIRSPQPAQITLTPPSVIRPGVTVAASTLFSASDPRGATVQGYSITTPSGTNGYFSLNGVRLSDNAQNYISAAQLSTLTFTAGAGSQPANFTVAAYNGTQWTDLSTETLNISAYKAPVITLTDKPPTAISGGAINMAGLIKSVSTDPTTAVQKYVVSASDGSFKLNGQTVSAKTPLTVSAADLNNLQFIAPATTTGKVTLNIAANDGTATSGSGSLQIDIKANTGPTISLLPTPQLLPGQPVPVSQLFNATDNTGSAITNYVVQINSGDGSFQLDGTALPTTGPQTISSADIGKLSYVPGSNVTSFTVSANDAIANGQATTLVLSTTQSQNSITVAANPLPSVAHNTTIPLKQLLSGIAGVGKTLQGFNLSTDSGQFLLNGVALTAAQASLVSAADFANITFSAPGTPGIVHLTSSAYDGTNFGPALTIALSIT